LSSPPTRRVIGESARQPAISRIMKSHLVREIRRRRERQICRRKRQTQANPYHNIHLTYPRRDDKSHLLKSEVRARGFGHYWFVSLPHFISISILPVSTSIPPLSILVPLLVWNGLVNQDWEFDLV